MGNFLVELKKYVDDSYEIETGYGLQGKLIQDLQNGLVGSIKSFAVITDDCVKKLYAGDILFRLQKAGFQAKLFSFEAGEASKTREMKARLEDEMLLSGFRRDCCVIAVGGGVVTDLAGFLAGTFARGVPFINYATTLLSAADAAVGGKTAVDTPLATNLIGLFYQPRKVYIDIETWKTLPKRQLSSGMAETIKHACLADPKLFSFLEKHMDELLHEKVDFSMPLTRVVGKNASGSDMRKGNGQVTNLRETYTIDVDNTQKQDPNESDVYSAWEYIAQKNCEIKYKVVMQDEKEKGLREVLNLGHTVGRAIETVSEYRLLHGEALAIGLTYEVMLSKSLGFVTDNEEEAVIALLKRAKLPTRIPDYIDREALLQKLYTDKKVKNGRLRFVLQRGIGAVVEFSRGVYSTELDEALIREVLMEL